MQTTQDNRVQLMAAHIAASLPEGANAAVVLSAIGYIASVIFADVKDANLRAQVLDKFVEALRTSSSIPNNVVQFPKRGEYLN